MRAHRSRHGRKLTSLRTTSRPATAATAAFATRSASSPRASRSSPIRPTCFSCEPPAFARQRPRRPVPVHRTGRQLGQPHVHQWQGSVAAQILGSTRPWDEQSLDVHASICRAIGHDFCDYQVHSIQRWLRRSVVADRYRDGRIFLVGDSAHQLTPTGGFGMNTGIGDAIDLSWKLQAMIEGWGGESCSNATKSSAGRSASAMCTRRPTTSISQQKTPSNPDLLKKTPAGERARAEIGERFRRAMHKIWENDGVQLGYYYEDSPICVPDGTPPPIDDPVNYHPTARPGSRAPHAWLSDGRSLHRPLRQRLCLAAHRSRCPGRGRHRRRGQADAGVPLNVIGSTTPRWRGSTSASSCWSALMAMSPGAPTRRRHRRWT